ncbi:hypothetical protein ABZY81_42875 [Streptomyces sp. NPDC006514]|uniref:hypothetical protein n=1 Tax=Streptomyces sp. NPDC006514 TaxID=3154308 RepID=UPI0033AD0CD4
MQPLRDAIGNPRRDAVLARRAERMKEQAEYQEQLRRAAEQKRAEREAARPVCAGCGTKFDNDRWENSRLSPEPGHRWHPTLCEPCEDKTVAAADQAERDRLEAEATVTAEKARGCRSRFRPGQAPLSRWRQKTGTHAVRAPAKNAMALFTRLSSSCSALPTAPRRAAESNGASTGLSPPAQPRRGPEGGTTARRGGRNRDRV